MLRCYWFSQYIENSRFSTGAFSIDFCYYLIGKDMFWVAPRSSKQWNTNESVMTHDFFSFSMENLHKIKLWNHYTNMNKIWSTATQLNHDPSPIIPGYDTTHVSPDYSLQEGRRRDPVPAAVSSSKQHGNGFVVGRCAGTTFPSAGTVNTLARARAREISTST